MFVRSTEFVKGKQDVVPPGIVAACRIRFAIADEFDRRGRHLFCLLRKFPFECAPRSPEGKRGLSCGAAVILNSKLMSQVVQRGTEVDQDVADARGFGASAPSIWALASRNVSD